MEKRCSRPGNRILFLAPTLCTIMLFLGSCASGDIHASPSLEDLVLIALGIFLCIMLFIIIVLFIRNRQQKTAMLQQENYRHLISKIQAAVVVHDASSKIIACNPKATELLGFPEEELIGKKNSDPLWRFLREDGGAMNVDDYPVSRVLATRLPVKEYVIGTIQPRTGNVVWVMVNADPEFDESGTVTEIVVTFLDITEWKKMEQHLISSELELKKAQKVSHVGNWQWNIPADTLEWSDEMFHIFGINKSTFTGSLREVIKSAIHPDDRAKVEESNASVITRGQPVPLEYRIIWPDRSVHIVWAEAGELVRDAEGNPAVLTGIVQEITERKKAEELLEMLRHSIDLHSDGAYWMDSENKFVYVNEEGCRALGYSREELIGHTVFEVNPRVTPELMAKTWQRLREAGHFSTESIHRRKDGTLFPVEIMSTYINFGGREYNCGFARDITERKRVQEALATNEEYFRRIFTQGPIGMTLADRGFRFTRANQAMCEMLGYSEPELCALSFKDITPPDRVNRDAEQIGLLARGEIESYKTEKKYVRKDGSFVWGALTVSAIRDTKGEVTYFIAMVENISDRKKAEEALRHANEQLLQSQKLESLGLLAGGVAHDFNNLLTPILGYIDLIQEGFGEQDAAYRQLESMRHAAERAQDLTRRLLAFSRKQPIELRIIRIEEVLARTGQILQEMIRENIRVSIEASDNLLRIRADAGQIEQILINLSMNAQEAMPEGGALIIRAETITEKTANGIQPQDPVPLPCVMLSVSDNGKGMDEQTIPHIFDPFYTTKELGKGTGLGLSTVYGIVKQHGASITVESTPEKGTAFRIYFPGITQGAEEKTLQDQASARTPVKGGGKILLVEDNEIVRTLASDMLKRLGYQVVEAASVHECDSLLDTHGDSIIMLLTDVVMPDMNGKELYDSLRKKRPDLRVLFMSGHADGFFGEHNVIAAGVPFIQKPFTMKLFSAKIREVLEKSG